jgi:hypothetical protein
MSESDSETEYDGEIQESPSQLQQQQQQLPELIKEWTTTEEEIKVLTAEIREKKKKVQAVRKIILSIMKGSQIGKVNISSGSITNRTTKAKSSLTKKYIIETLTLYFGNAEQAKACAKFLEDNRTTRYVDHLKLETSTTSQET